MKKNSKKYVIYLRVSTKEQGISGLGIEAQKEAILKVIKQSDIIAEFIEVASGKSNFRPKLIEAIELCSKENYGLVVAKLDRLGRNASYLFEIRDKIKDLVIIDNPDIDTIKFGMYATFAQYEREAISQRTKAALKARYDKTGLKNGQKKGYDMLKARIVASKVKKEKAMLSNNNQVAKNIIEIELKKGSSYRQIAEYLNKIGIRTPKDKDFKVSSIQKIIKLYGLKKESN